MTLLLSMCAISVLSAASVQPSPLPIPEVVARNVSLYGLASDGQSLYWSNGAELRRGFSGGGGITTTTPGLTSAYKVQAVDGDFVYLITAGDGKNTGGVARVRKRGGALERLAGAEPFSNRLIVRGNTVYWTSPRGLMALPLNAEAQPSLLAPILHAVTLAANGTHVYVGQSRDGGDIVRVPIAGGAPQVVAAKQARPFGLALSDDALYWVNHGTHGDTSRRPPTESPEDSGLMKLSLAAGSEPQRLHSGGRPQSLTIRGRYGFWADRRERGAVYRIDLDTDEIFIVAMSVWYPTEIVVQGKWVYWSTASALFRARAARREPAYDKKLAAAGKPLSAKACERLYRRGFSFMVTDNAGVKRRRSLVAFPNPQWRPGADSRPCSQLGARWHPTSGREHFVSGLAGFGHRPLALALRQCPIERRPGQRKCAPCKPPGPCHCSQTFFYSWFFCEKSH